MTTFSIAFYHDSYLSTLYYTDTIYGTYRYAGRRSRYLKKDLKQISEHKIRQDQYYGWSL